MLIWLNRCAENQTIRLRNLLLSNNDIHTFLYRLIEYLQLNRMFVTSFINFITNSKMVLEKDK